jgi:hypothetical protein
MRRKVLANSVPRDSRPRHWGVHFCVATALLLGLPCQDAGAQTADAVLSELESAIQGVKDYDVVYSVNQCAGFTTGAIPTDGKLDGINYDASMTLPHHDRVSRRFGRRIHRTLSSGRPIGLMLRRLEANESPAELSIMHFLCPGMDYLGYVRPRLGSRDLITALKEHPATRVVRSAAAPDWIGVEIPVDQLAEFNDLGARVWCDTSRGLMPSRVDVYVQIEGREILTTRTDMELTEVEPGVFCPTQGTRAEIVGAVNPSDSTGLIQFFELTVEVKDSKWNASLSKADFDSPLLTAPGVTRDVTDGWTTIYPLPDGPFWTDMGAGKSRGAVGFWFVLVNIVLLVSIGAGWMLLRRTRTV